MMEFNDRIIAGEWKGRKFVLPVAEEVRPSKNRVRQAVFNFLTSRLMWDNLSVVDICCGSGAWGLEAASRGATQVWLVDKEIRVARNNVQSMPNGKQLEAVEANAHAWRPPAPVDVVLADPPYGTGIAQALIQRAAELGKPGSWWAIETGNDAELQWLGFEEVEWRDYGRSRLWVGRQK